MQCHIFMIPLYTKLPNTKLNTELGNSSPRARARAGKSYGMAGVPNTKLNTELGNSSPCARMGESYGMAKSL